MAKTLNLKQKQYCNKFSKDLKKKIKSMLKKLNKKKNVSVLNFNFASELPVIFFFLIIISTSKIDGCGRFGMGPWNLFVFICKSLQIFLAQTED